MVAHSSSNIFETYFLVGNYPQRHVFGIGVLAKNPRQIAVEVVGKAVKETVNTCIAEPSSAESRFAIDIAPREILILTRVPSL